MASSDSNTQTDKPAQAQQVVREAFLEGAKCAVVAALAIGVPLKIARNRIPSVRKAINHAGQTFITSSAGVATLVFVGDRKIEQTSKRQAKYHD